MRHQHTLLSCKLLPKKSHMSQSWLLVDYKTPQPSLPFQQSLQRPSPEPGMYRIWQMDVHCTGLKCVRHGKQAARLASILQSTSAPFGKPNALEATKADGPFSVPTGFVDPPYEPGLDGINGLHATSTGRAFAAAKDPAVAWESAAQAKR